MELVPEPKPKRDGGTPPELEDADLPNLEEMLRGDVFDEWLAKGLERGFVGPPVCSTHDGIPTTEEEDLEWEEGDPCVHVLRLYEDLETKTEVEANHSPSNWRKPRPVEAD